MNTEKETYTAQTFHQNMENAEKWFRESSEAMTHSFEKQVEFTTSLFEKVLETSVAFNKAALERSQDWSEKMNDITRHNMETFSETMNFWKDLSDQLTSSNTEKEFHKPETEKKESTGNGHVSATAPKTPSTEPKLPIADTHKKPTHSKN